MKLHFGFLIALCVGLLSLGCEGDAGPAGPEGPAGPPGSGVSEFTYQGDFGEPCLHCHANLVGNYLTTGHREAYADLGADQGNLYCLQCHTTGFDSQVAFGDTEIDPANRGPDVNGYDDYFGLTDTESVARMAALEGVQCESCHGAMGPDFNAHQPNLSLSTHNDASGASTSLCFPCHETQLEEWYEAGHALVAGGDIVAFNEEHYVNNSGCDYCHTSEGFIRVNDPRYATYDFPDDQSFIGCVTCHDPHIGEAGGGNYAQLRNVGPEEVVYTFPWLPGDAEVARMEGFGPAQTCAQCHHARRNTANVLGQIANGYGHFGPHGSPQMDMFIGAGSYVIPGYTYDSSHGHQTIGTACVKCHMVRETELHGEIVEHPFHTWEPTVDNCVPCHTGITDFDVNGGQTAIQGKLDQIAVILGYVDAADFAAKWDDDNVNPAMPVWQREVAYAAMFVLNDGSSGAHNPSYANALLDNAITYAGTFAP